MRMTLKAARINAGLRQTDMALSLGVDRKTVGSWENGKSMPTADKIERICDILGLNYDNIQWNV